MRLRKDKPMKKFVIEVEKVHGLCSWGYQVGDRVVAEDLNTPRE